MDNIHTVPVNDLREHEDSEDCWCGPDCDMIETDLGDYVYNYIHHSLDGREHYEPDHDKEACPLCSISGDGKFF